MKNKLKIRLNPKDLKSLRNSINTVIEYNEKENTKYGLIINSNWFTRVYK